MLPQNVCLYRRGNQLALLVSMWDKTTLQHPRVHRSGSGALRGEIKVGQRLITCLLRWWRKGNRRSLILSLTGRGLWLRWGQDVGAILIAILYVRLKTSH